jgi:branched-subunit amino acid transport protein
MDNFWFAIIIGSIAVYSWKILGFALPKRFAEKEEVVVFAGKLTVALLAALTAVQTFAVGQSLVLDSRLPALAVAALLYWRKAPFIVAVAVAALVAALLRNVLGWA